MNKFSLKKYLIIKFLFLLFFFTCSNLALAQSEDFVEPTKIVKIKMRDGVEISAAIFLPEGDGKYPTLFAASPYRFDNNYAPAIPMYLWRETGPVAWYLKQGYAYVHMDVRGSGRSGGEYHFLDRKEQRDLYEVIEWIAKQSWSNGKVGGIGQSYYAMTQWFMATQNPPHLSCIAPYDGLIDLYRSSAFSGGIPGEFWHVWYSSIMRPIHQYPLTDLQGVCLGIYPMKPGSIQLMMLFGKKGLRLKILIRLRYQYTRLVYGQKLIYI